MATDIAAQIERRRQRGIEEVRSVINRGSHPLFSPFEVTSLSGRTYRVQVRSLAEMHNTCTCPDYRTNLIGTCKHIEGVLQHLKAKHGKRLAILAKQRPPGTQIYLHYEQEITVRVGLPLPSRMPLHELLGRHFDPQGVLLGSVTGTLPGLLAAIEGLPTHDRALIQVDDAVREHLELCQDREAVQKQKEWFLDQVQQGQRSFTVLSTRLYPYQEVGSLHLAFGCRAMLADDMGLGKTVQAIAACALLKQLRDIQKVLVVTPASLKHQWAREIRRFSSLPVTVVQGGLLARRRAYAEPSFFTVVNYELVRRDIEELEGLRANVIILDEAQRIKNWRTKTAGAVKRLRSRYAFVLTGTPLENRLDELYSIFQFLDPRILGPLWHFNDRFYQLEQRPDGSYKVLGYRNLDQLRATIGPYVLRRTREAVLQDLPARVDNHFFVEMTDLQWQAYNEFKEIVARLLAKAKRRPLTPRERDILLKSLIKMRLICNALALHDRDIPPKDREKTSPKLQELHQILTDEIVNNGHKALVFSQWADMLALTEPVIRRLGLVYVKLTGAVPSAKRGALIDRFFADPDCRVFLSTDAGGLGLNLQAASLVINLDLPWNPAVLEQRIGRAHRHGQSSTVHVLNLIAKDTIEERILDTLAAKRHVFAGVFGTEERLTEISFRDAGQDLLRRLDEMLGAPREAVPRLDLEPTLEEKREVTKTVTPQPTLHGFADLLVARFPGRILLVRRAPGGDGVLVVTDREPLELRPSIEALLAGHFPDAVPTLHLMEQEGWRTLATLFAGTPPPPGDEAYWADALPSAAGVDGRDAAAQQRKKAREALVFAVKRLTLAEVVLRGGFPEESFRPIREALGWGLSAHLALVKDHDPSPEVPAARVVQADLVESGRVPDDLALRLARVRELTEPEEPDHQGAGPLPSVKTGEALLAAVRELIELGQARVVEEGL